MVDRATSKIQPNPTGIGTTPSAEGFRLDPIPEGIGTVPNSPSMRLEPTDEAKVRDIQRQAAEHKAALGEVQMRYDRQKAVIMDMLNRCDTRAASIVGEAALAKGLDPASVHLDWNTYTFVQVKEKKP